MPVIGPKPEEVELGRILKHRLFAGEYPMSYRHFIDHLSGETTFRQEFASVRSVLNIIKLT